MRELLLLRHAKSDWSDAGLPDHERPLAGRGRRAAPAMGRWMVEEGLRPDRVLCSTAVRTRQTWERVEAELAEDGESPPVVFLEELYLASPRTMLDAVRTHGGDAERLLVIAHNPGTHDLAVSLCISGPDRDLDRLDRKFPTAALARIQFEGDEWEAARPGAGRLLSYLRPKDLEDADKLRL